jgi:hypothetical protein
MGFSFTAHCNAECLRDSQKAEKRERGSGVVETKKREEPRPFPFDHQNVCGCVLATRRKSTRDSNGQRLGGFELLGLLQRFLCHVLVSSGFECAPMKSRGPSRFINKELAAGLKFYVTRTNGLVASSFLGFCSVFFAMFWFPPGLSVSQ